MTPRLLTSAAAAVLLAACSDNDSSGGDSVAIEAQLQTAVAAYDVRALDSTLFDVPSINDPLAQLGKKVFFTKALGGENDSACATCHHPMLGGGDDLSLPIGVGAIDPDLLGPGRLHKEGADFYDGGPTVPRNAPSIFNFVLYQKSVFHDGRIEVVDGGIRTPNSAFGEPDPKAGDTLAAAQARFPVTSAEEMRGFHFAGNEGDDARDLLGERLRGESGDLSSVAVLNWDGEFAAVFGRDQTPVVDYQRAAAAIAAYENSQLFIDNPWFRYLNGDRSAMTSAGKRGAILFTTPAADGGAGCAGCHSGPTLTDESFHVLAIPQVGRGKGDDDDAHGDYGRFRETGILEDKYAFRTPTLLNVEETGPYGHDGAYTTMEAVIRHHLDPLKALENYDPSLLDASVQLESLMYSAEAAVEQLEALRIQGKSMLPVVNLDDGQVSDLVAFMKALTDPCVQDRSCVAPWIPDASDSDPDGMRLVARDGDGNLL